MNAPGNAGTTYIDAVDLIGRRGRRRFSRGYKGMRQETYEWTTTDGSWASATVRNGLLVSKAQFGLK